MKRVETGVFLPIARNGFVNSTNAPPYIPSWRDNLEISLLAEEIGMDYVFSMSKWRGFGGSTHFWDSSFESFSLMAALAAATRRIDLIATVTPLLYHPTMLAKMAATIDDVSGGRLGLNIITGATIGEYAQMGVVPEGYDTRRYEYATEWVQALKRLWSEPSVTCHGEFFHLEDCVSEPKPVRKPRPFLVCAASSDEGLRFTAREADISFISSRSIDTVKERSRRAKEIAAEENRSLRTAVPLMMVIGDTRSKAEAYQEYLMKGADVEGMANIGSAQLSQTRAGARAHGAERISNNRQIYSGLPAIGSPRDVADAIIELALDGDVDNVLLMCPDYLEVLRRFEADVMPLLRKSLDVGHSDPDAGPTPLPRQERAASSI